MRQLFTKSTLIFILASVLAGSANSAAKDLAALFELGNIWSASPTDFFGAINTQGEPPAFDWAGQTEQTRARYPAYRNSSEITLFGLHLWGVTAIFEDSKLARIECSLYNKGDAEVAQDEGTGVIRDQEAFVAMLEKSASRIDAWAGQTGKNLEARRLTTTGVRMMRRAWVKKPYLVEMRWAFTDSGRRRGDDFLAEYITVVFTPYSRENDPTRTQMSSVRDRYDGWAEDKDRSGNVKTNFQDDVYIEGIPMVNQGEKGYCVVAVLERILAYFGAEIDQHALAQLGESTGSGGTVMEIMLESLKQAETRLGVRVRVEYNIGEDVRDYIRLARDYNRQARRMRTNQIEDEQWVAVQGRSRMYHVQNFVAAMDPEVYKTLRNERARTELNRFKRAIKEEVDQGRPLMWGVWLGIVDEPGVVLQGGTLGHARLIIGYNQTKDEILYSDTWGRGHELKRMSIEDAWTMTTFLTTITPRRRQY